jgi:hypothetical protein
MPSHAARASDGSKEPTTSSSVSWVSYQIIFLGRKIKGTSDRITGALREYSACTVRHDITRRYFELALYRRFLYYYAYPTHSRWSYGLLGSLGRRHAQTSCDFGFIRPRNVRCHQGHWSWSWPARPHIEVYIVENPMLQETELGEYWAHLVGGVCVVGLLWPCSTLCVLQDNSKPNAPTPRGILV